MAWVRGASGAWALLVGCAALAGTAHAQSNEELATVRVEALRGLVGRPTPGEVPRVVALPDVRTGTGVIVDTAGLVVVPRRVVEGAHLVVLHVPGRIEPIFGAPLEGEGELAFIAVGEALSAQLEPAASEASVRQSVRVTGWADDAEAPSRVDARVRDVGGTGFLLDGALEPGHVGGAIVDRTGKLVGLLAAAGSTGQGRTLAQLSEARGQIDAEALAAARARVPHDEVLAELASLLAGLVEHDTIDQIDAALSMDLEARLRRAHESAQRTEDPDAVALAAALHWDAMVVVMDRSGRVMDPERLPAGTDRDQAVAWRARAIELAYRAARLDGAVQTRSPWVAFITRTFPAPTAATPAAAAVDAEVETGRPTVGGSAAPGEIEARAPAYGARTFLPFLVVGVPFAPSSNIALDGGLFGGGLHVAAARIGNAAQAVSLALVLGGGTLVGGWQGGAVFALCAEAGIDLQFGAPIGFVAQVVWTPGLVAARGTATGVAAAFRGMVGVAVDDLRVGLAFRGLDRVGDKPLTAVELMASYGF